MDSGKLAMAVIFVMALLVLVGSLLIDELPRFG
jgi:hypothetical protein